LYQEAERLRDHTMAHTLVTQVQQDDDQSGLASLVTQVQPVTNTPAGKTPSKGGLFSCLFCCCSSEETSTAPANTALLKSVPNSTAKKNPEPTKQQAPSETTTANGATAEKPAEDEEEPQDVQWLLPAQIPEEKGRKTLVLDLDETLVHSSFKPITDADFTIDIELDGMTHKVYVRKRPGVDEFMIDVGKKWEVVIFTASLAKYADPLLDVLDPQKVVRARLFRESCVQHYGNYVKDLSLLGRRMEDCVIVDNSPFSYMFQPDNAIPIISWFNDRSDTQLYELMPFLDSLLSIDDVSTVLQKQPVN